MKKFLLIALIALAIAAFIGYKFLYKEHRDIATEEAEFTIPVSTLQQEFTANYNAANSKYADKAIAVSGKVTSADTSANSIVVDGRLSVVLKDKMPEIAIGETVSLKGRFVGYDDLLEELKMDQANLIK